MLKCEYCGTLNLLGDTLKAGLNTPTVPFLIWLHNTMVATLSKDDIKQICYNLCSITMLTDYDYENVEGNTLNSKSRELISLCRRRGTLQLLVATICDVSRNFAITLEGYDG